MIQFFMYRNYFDSKTNTRYERRKLCSIQKKLFEFLKINDTANNSINMKRKQLRKQFSWNNSILNVEKDSEWSRSNEQYYKKKYFIIKNDERKKKCVQKKLYVFELNWIFMLIFHFHLFIYVFFQEDYIQINNNNQYTIFNQ